MRGITEILPLYVKIISELIRIGEDVRHAKHYGTPSFMLLGDNKQSITSLHVNVEDLSPDDQIVASGARTPLMSSFSCQTLSQRGQKALMHKSGQVSS